MRNSAKGKHPFPWTFWKEIVTHVRSAMEPGETLDTFVKRASGPTVCQDLGTQGTCYHLSVCPPSICSVPAPVCGIRRRALGVTGLGEELHK